MAPKAKKSAPPAVNPEVAEFMEKLRTETTDTVMEMKETFEKLAIQYKSDALDRIEADIPQEVLDMKFVDLVKMAERDRTVAQKAPSSDLFSTVQRPPRVKQLDLVTPAGSKFKCPSFITPRVDGMAPMNLASRTIRRDEVAFSISGSPVVLEENADPQIQAISKLLAGDGNDLSPESSKLANAVKNLLKDKFKI